MRFLAEAGSFTNSGGHDFSRAEGKPNEIVILSDAQPELAKGGQAKDLGVCDNFTPAVEEKQIPRLALRSQARLALRSG